MKCDRRWWNDGRYEREAVAFERKHGKAVEKPWPDGTFPPPRELTLAEREFVCRLIRMELASW